MVVNSFTAEIWDEKQGPILRGIITSNRTVVIFPGKQLLSYSWQVVIVDNPGTVHRFFISAFKTLDIGLIGAVKVILRNPIVVAGIVPLRRNQYVAPYPSAVFEVGIIGPIVDKSCASVGSWSINAYYYTSRTIRSYSPVNCDYPYGSAVLNWESGVYRLVGFKTDADYEFFGFHTHLLITNVPGQYWHSTA